MKSVLAIRLFMTLWSLLLVLAPQKTLGQILIQYPRAESQSDYRYEYDWAVLRAALDKTVAKFGPYVMQPTGSLMTQKRIAMEMEMSSRHLNIFVRATSLDLERRFIPIRLPVDRGLLGYRVLLVRSAELERFAAVRDLDGLRKFSIGMGIGWNDVEIMRAAGFHVIEGDTYEGLFAMLSHERLDAFSRSLGEAYREFDDRRASFPDITIEPTLLICLPLPRYFFVRRDAQGAQLAKRIETGMEIMIRDGTLQKLFDQYKTPGIVRAGVDKRRLLRIPNPQLPPETPLSRHELWYDPLEKKPLAR